MAWKKNVNYCEYDLSDIFIMRIIAFNIIAIWAEVANKTIDDM